MKYYLDTNTIIYYIKGKFPALINHFGSVPRQSILIPEIVLAEIEYGARKSDNYEQTISKYRMFTDSFEKVAFARRASSIYGTIRADLEKKGIPIGPNDLIIASTVLAEDGVLVTHNIKEFGRIPNLRIEDWTQN